MPRKQAAVLEVRSMHESLSQSGNSGWSQVQAQRAEHNEEAVQVSHVRRDVYLRGTTEFPRAVSQGRESAVLRDLQRDVRQRAEAVLPL